MWTGTSGEAGDPSIYFDARLNSEVAKIFPGQYFVTDRDIVLATVLLFSVALLSFRRLVESVHTRRVELGYLGDAAAGGGE